MGENPPLPVWPGNCESWDLDVWCSLNADMPEKMRSLQKMESDKTEKGGCVWGKTDLD